MINDFLSRLPGIQQDFIYDLLKYQELKLCLDVGAAAGVITRQIKQAGSESTRVIGFEPFEGNHAYFEQTTRGLSNVQLIKKAAHSKTRPELTFRVLSTVQGSEAGWEQRTGYSSTGFLVEGNACEAFQKKRSTTQDFTVDAIAIDDLIDEHVDFMKIDVQGGEYEVLKGCQHIITHHGIDVIYLEFDGDRRILEYLTALGYTVFDSDYLLILKQDDLEPLKRVGFYNFEELNLSVGRKAYRAKLQLCDEDYCAFLEAFRQQIGYFIYTDLICVSPAFLSSFLNHVVQYSKLQSRIKSDTKPQSSGKENIKPIRLTSVLSSGGNQKKRKKRQKNVAANSSSMTQHSISVSSVSPTSTSQELKSSQRSSLFEKIARYYSRWPLGVALLAIASSAATGFDIPVRWGFVMLSTVLIVFLSGHAASKADRVLKQVNSLKDSLGN